MCILSFPSSLCVCVRTCVCLRSPHDLSGFVCLFANLPACLLVCWRVTLSLRLVCVPVLACVREKERETEADIE